MVASAFPRTSAATNSRSTTGATKGTMNWYTAKAGRISQPSTPPPGRKRRDLCFQHACRMPYVQRKRCLSSVRAVSGASV